MSDPEPVLLLRRIARLAHELGPALAPTSHAELLRSITETAKELFNAAACSLGLLSDDGSEIVFHIASGAGASEVTGLRIPSDQGIAGWVVRAGQPLSIEDVSTDPRFAQEAAESTGYVPRSILAMPLETQRGRLGVIEVLDPSTEGTRDMDLLALFARQAALAIESGRAFSDLGRLLFGALAESSGEDDLREVLSRVAEQSPQHRELGELAALFQELAEAGPDERNLAVDVLSRVLEYTRARW